MLAWLVRLLGEGVVWLVGWFSVFWGFFAKASKLDAVLSGHSEVSLKFPLGP